MKKVFDPVRQCFVHATPEEMVRQQWISVMIEHLGFPKGLLSVEKNLSRLCQNKTLQDLNRRVDLVCFVPDKEFIPLLIIEFKSEDQHLAPEKQVAGYNFYLDAPFWAVIQGEKVHTFWKEHDKIQSVNFLPSFPQLLQKMGLKWETY